MIHVPKYSYQWSSKRLYQIRRAADPSPIHPDRTFVLEVAILLPLDSWDEAAGFKLGDADIFARRDAELEKMAEEVQEKIEAQQRT